MTTAPEFHSGDDAAREVDVAVVVVSFNSSDVLPGLIASLPDGLRGLSWHLVLADNDSHDESIALVAESMPDATIVSMGRNAGYAAGINAAVRAAPSFRAVLALNPDVRLHPGTGAGLLAELDRSGVGIVVPRLLDGDGNLIYSLRRRPTLLRALGDMVVGADRAGRIPILGEVVTDPRRYDHAQDTDWAEGSTMLISRECWDRSGPWDESFFLYSEETDFALRAQDDGFITRYLPSETATHLEGSSGISPGLWRLLVTNRVRLYRRRHGPMATAAFWLLTLAREGSRAVLGRPTNRAATAALLDPRTLGEKPGPHSVAWPRTN